MCPASALLHFWEQPSDSDVGLICACVKIAEKKQSEAKKILFILQMYIFIM